jgi:ribosomal protein S18 acetylase RimI-like enzyme
MQIVEEAAREFGVNAIHLEVTRSNTAAQKLYTKMGFGNHDHVLMTKWIGDGSR